jgi:hypothetical protein
MVRLLSISLVAVASAAMLCGCFALRAGEREHAQEVDPMLAAAGFKMNPTDTLEKSDHLKAISALKLKSHVKDGQPQYWLADPFYCNCVYVGDQAAYQRYKQLRAEADAQAQIQHTEMIEEEQSEAAMEETIGYPP